jgi:hypothetical protein
MGPTAFPGMMYPLYQVQNGPCMPPPECSEESSSTSSCSTCGTSCESSNDSNKKMSQQCDSCRQSCLQKCLLPEIHAVSAATYCVPSSFEQVVVREFLCAAHEEDCANFLHQSLPHGCRPRGISGIASFEFDKAMSRVCFSVSLAFPNRTKARVFQASLHLAPAGQIGPAIVNLLPIHHAVTGKPRTSCTSVTKCPFVENQFDNESILPAKSNDGRFEVVNIASLFQACQKGYVYYSVTGTADVGSKRGVYYDSPKEKPECKHPRDDCCNRYKKGWALVRGQFFPWTLQLPETLPPPLGGRLCSFGSDHDPLKKLSFDTNDDSLSSENTLGCNNPGPTTTASSSSSASFSSRPSSSASPENSLNRIYGLTEKNLSRLSVYTRENTTTAPLSFSPRDNTKEEVGEEENGVLVQKNPVENESETLL